MAKRLTDSEKWKDPWFKKLKGEMQLFWLFALDSCDHAGIWKDQLDDFNHTTGFNLTFDAIAKSFSGRIIPLNEETFFIPKFITFQYTNFNAEKNNAHRGVMRSLDNFDIKYSEVIEFIRSERSSLSKKIEAKEPLVSPCQGAQDKEQDKDKVMDMVKEQDKDRAIVNINDFFKGIEDYV